MAYKIGTRVKKVRGEGNIGMTGMVCSGPAEGGWTLDRSASSVDTYIRTDCPWISRKGGWFPSGTVCMASSEMWEPIQIDKTPCESEFKESLDKLLSEVSRETV